MKIEFDSLLERYIIVDEDTGEILDDAQGYGFRTKQGAYKAYYYNQNKEKLIEESLIIVDWWNEHKSLYNKICEDFFYYWKDQSHEMDPKPLSTKEIKDYLNRIQEFVDAPFDAYKMWKYYDSAYKTVKQFKNKQKKKNQEKVRK